MARVVGVADTFDAITTQRVYQNPYTPEEALGIIRKLDGKGFDPRIVKAFLEAYENGDISVLPITHHQRVHETGRSEAEPVHT